MNYINIKHLDFVPAKMFKDATNERIIYVFTNKINNRTYKKKRAQIGLFYFDDKCKVYAFEPVEKVSFGRECLETLSWFGKCLDYGKIKFNAKAGELVKCQEQ